MSVENESGTPARADATAPPDIDSLRIATGEVASDDSVSRLRDLDVQRQAESNRRQKWDTHLRSALALVLMLMFLIANVGVGWLIHDAYSSELALLKSKQILAADRSITPGVFMSLIGASVVQVGAGIATILAYLFPRGDVKSE